MPFYEYRCELGHSFECLQRMGAEPIATCTVCGAPAQRVFRAPAVHFKGSGFYTTDYGKKGRAAPSGETNGDGVGKKEKTSDSKAGSDSKATSGSADTGSSSSSD